MMKMEIKHLAPYLPYDLKVVFEADEHEHTLVGLVNWSNEIMVLSPFSDYGRSNIKNCKPILRPLKNLRKFPLNEDKSYGDKIDLIGYFDIKDFIDSPKGRKYWQVQKLFEWHFDVFGLIEKGLAVDINELKH